jgi:hypothetical protein
VNDTHPARPSRARSTATARVARPGTEPALTAIPPRPGDVNDRLAADRELPGPVAAPGRAGAAPAARGRRRWLAAGGAVAAVIPAGPGLAWAIAGRPDAALVVAAAALVALATGFPYAIAAMYEARQETRRTEIVCHPANTLADALASAMEAAHTMARNVSGAEEIEEARRVRKDSRLLLADTRPVVTVLLEYVHPRRGQPSPPADRPGA